MNLSKERVIKFSLIPDWCESVLGYRVNRSTCHRWRTRGARGAKLETILVGGMRFTSIEALERFFEAATSAADCSPEPLNSCTDQAVALAAAEAYLESEGI